MVRFVIAGTVVGKDISYDSYNSPSSTDGLLVAVCKVFCGLQMMNGIAVWEYR